LIAISVDKNSTIIFPLPIELMNVITDKKGGSA